VMKGAPAAALVIVPSLTTSTPGAPPPSPVERRLLQYQADWHANSYTAAYFWWKKRALVQDAFRRSLRARGERPARVLDIGCGDGMDMFLLSTISPSSTFLGIDINRESVDYVRMRAAHEQNGMVDATQARVEALRERFAPGSFDFIVCSELVEHLERPHEVLRDMASLLAPDGWAVVTTPNVSRSRALVGRALGLPGAGEDAHHDEARHEEIGHGHISEKGWREWRRIFRSAGFRVRRIRREALLYGSRWLDERPLLASGVVIADRLLDALAPIPALAAGNAYVLTKGDAPAP